MRIRFLTGTPLDIRRGSGTYVGMHVLARALRGLGHEVVFETPDILLPVFTAQRLLFNRMLRRDPQFDLTVGFDMDGYRIAAGVRNHVASLKGVIADEVRFESGFIRLTMGMQARCERLHAQRAALVLATSRYSADRAQEFYGLRKAPAIVPELIDLAEWRSLLDANPAPPKRFTVLFVGRFYRRKRVDVLLHAAAQARTRIPELEVRIVGNGPCTSSLHHLSRELHLDAIVTWLGDVSRPQLAQEYNRAHVFCLPSVQEGFGIVLLEAMAAGKPIVAARAAAIPEVAPSSTWVDPDNAESLAAGIDAVYRSGAFPEPAAWQERFDAPRVARQFMEAVS